VSVHRLAELAPRELEARLAEMPALLLPLGTLEWHSHHLPVGLDGLKAEAVAAAAAGRCGAMLAPTAWWAAGGVPFPWTLRLPGGLVEPLLEAALRQLAGMGFRVVAVVNGHYGLENTLVVRRAAAAVTRESGAVVLAVADYELLLGLGATGDHAGVFETALGLAARPELVHLDAVGVDEPLEGVIGDDPRGRADEQLGRRALDAAARTLAGAVERALAEPPDAYLAALDAGNRALEQLWRLRAELPRDRVPPVQTGSWLEHVAALHEGRYADARAAAARKLADPAA
jgi:creatinine amidohydrolase